jgi:serine/threonine protein phosphatase 1
VGSRLIDGDRIVYLGNYLGHGAAIIAAIDELLDFRRRVLSRRSAFCCDVVYLRGAQEEMWQKLLQLQFASNPGAVLDWMVRAGVEATVEGYGGDMRQGFAATRDGPRTITRWTLTLREAMNAVPGHTTLFTGLRHAALTEPNGLLFVHAAVNPARSLTDQGDAFWWGDADILELSQPFEGFARVIRGYDRGARGLVERDYAVSLDAGAGRGGRLVASCFDVSGTVLDHIEA